MDDLELKNLWKEYDQKIEEAKLINMQSSAINFKTFEYLQTTKAKSKLNALTGYKKRVIFIGVLWITFLLFLVLNSLAMSKIFFVISLSAIIVFNVVAIIFYIRQIILINEIDNSESLIEAQQKTSQLQASTLQIARILFVQSPFYCTFFWSPAMIASSWTAFFFISLPIALFFVFVSIWLYRNINYKNADKKWFKMIFSSKEWTSVIKAIKFMEEIEDFKSEVV